jgi:hypothetical protein
MGQSELMKTRWMWMAGWLAIGMLIAGISVSPMRGQEKTAAATGQPRAYDVTRELTLVGQVVSYSASNATPPLGPRAMLQTPSGAIDVHLGDAQLLEANHLTIESGDTLRIIGEEVSVEKGKQFVARIVQKGTQALVMRTAGGFPLSPAGSKDAAKANTPGGVR